MAGTWMTFELDRSVAVDLEGVLEKEGLFCSDRIMKTDNTKLSGKLKMPCISFLFKSFMTFVISIAVFSQPASAQSSSGAYYMYIQVQNTKLDGKSWDIGSRPDFVVFPGGKGKAAAGECKNLFTSVCEVKGWGDIPGVFYLHESDFGKNDAVGTASGRCTKEAPCRIRNAEDPKTIMGAIFATRTKESITGKAMAGLEMVRDQVDLTLTITKATLTKDVKSKAAVAAKAVQFISKYSGSRAAECVALGLGVATNGGMAFIADLSPTAITSFFSVKNHVQAGNMQARLNWCGMGGGTEENCKEKMAEWGCYNLEDCKQLANLKRDIGYKLGNISNLRDTNLFGSSCADID